MKHINWLIVFGLILILISISLSFIHFLIFQDIHTLLFQFGISIAFIPLNVLFVTLIINQLLAKREKKTVLYKVNMIIGAFFSEVGTTLINEFSKFDPNCEEIRKNLIFNIDWNNKDFLYLLGLLKNYDYVIEIISKQDLERMKDFLAGKRKFLLVLLENPILLENVLFTDLLWAVFHLMEELGIRDNIYNLAETDYLHLSGDIKRAYSMLISEWIKYMEHLKNNYPYLFSIAMRTNPFDNDACPEVK